MCWGPAGRRLVPECPARPENAGARAPGAPGGTRPEVLRARPLLRGSKGKRGAWGSDSKTMASHWQALRRRRPRLVSSSRPLLWAGAEQGDNDRCQEALQEDKLGGSCPERCSWLGRSGSQWTGRWGGMLDGIGDGSTGWGSEPGEQHAWLL